MQCFFDTRYVFEMNNLELSAVSETDVTSESRLLCFSKSEYIRIGSVFVISSTTVFLHIGSWGALWALESALT